MTFLYVYFKDPSVKEISNNNLNLPDISTPKHYVLSNTIQTHYSQFSPFYKGIFNFNLEILIYKI